MNIKCIALFILFWVVVLGLVDATDIEGILPLNSTWTLEDSPYYIVGNTLVPEGGTLIIEPSVQVKFKGTYYIKIAGTLVAVGNESHPINFTSSEGLSYVDDWESLQFESSSNNNVLHFCEISHVESCNGSGGCGGWALNPCPSILVDQSSLNISNCILKNYGRITYESPYESVLISNNIFDPAIYIDGEINGSFYIINNTFNSGNSIRTRNRDESPAEIYIRNNNFSSIGQNMQLKGAITPPISQNYFAGTIEFANDGNYLIEDNIIQNILSEGDDINVELRYNNIFGRIGLEAGDNVNIAFRYNNIFGTINLWEDYHRDYQYDVDAMNNWWNTTDTSEIDERIYDYYDDFDLGKVIYEPILTTPIDNISTTTTTTLSTTTTTTTSTTLCSDEFPDVDINHHAPVFFQGDTIEITISASDDKGIRYIWAGDDSGLYDAFDCESSLECSHTWYIELENEGLTSFVGVAQDSNGQFSRVIQSFIVVMDHSDIPVTTSTTLIDSVSKSSKSSGGSSGGAGGFSQSLPSCFDGIQNCHDGLCEDDIDCGGPCDSCMSCFDDIQNQGESGVDCGGPCDLCQTTTTSLESTTTTVSATSATSEFTSTSLTSESMAITPPGVTGRVVSFSEENSELVKGIGFGALITICLIAYTGFFIQQKKKLEGKK